jgi:hypothetical protein
MDVLALIRPTAFGRASRLRRQVMEFAATLGCEDQWQLEAAILFSQIGHFCLPTELLEKLHRGEKLTPQESILAGGTPHSASAVLKKVPRFEPVVQILTALTWTDEQIARLGDSTLGLCTRILGIALDYDALVTQGHTADASVQILRGRSARFGESLLEQFGAYIAAEPNNPELHTIPLGAVKPGMTLTQDVRTPNGTLLLARGFEVTEVFLQYARTCGPDLLNKSVRILVRSTPEVAGDAGMNT